MAGEKRTQDQEESLLSETIVLVDIEGTTSSISFVKETLFPYVRENLNKYIETKWEHKEFKKDLEKLKEQAKKDEEDKVDGFVSINGATPEEEKQSLIKNVLWQMDCDRKTGALKQLQGHMWREAYESGAVKGHVYEDVPKALESWTNDGRKVYVYSSGSVEAQKLLFANSDHGDLLKYFSGHFDTEVGAKQEASSYKNILSKIGAEPSAVVFLTDVVKEAAAAKEAGLSTIVVLREGNVPLTEDEKVAYTTIKSFLDLTFQTSTKRQKLDTAETREEATKKTTPDASEPMDTSEDVEMSDASEKKSEKTEEKGAIESETNDNAKNELLEATETSKERTEEPMITDAKDSSASERITEKEVEGKTESQTKSSEVSKTLASETAQPTVSENDKEKPKENDKEKSMITEQTEKSAEPTEKVAETVRASNEALKVDTCEPKTKSEQVSATEKKTDERVDTPKDKKSETITSLDPKSAEEQKGEKSRESNSTEGKAEECAKSEKEEIKAQSTTDAATNSSNVERTKAEGEDAAAKPTQEKENANVDAPAAENGVALATNDEKVTAPTISESEAITSKQDAKVEVTGSTEATSETKVETESEAAVEKSPKVKDTEEVGGTASNPDAEKREVSAEASKQDAKDSETVKEETVVAEVKDKNTVDAEKKKLNGTTQNGDTEVPVSDDKLHRNGLNEGSSSEKLNSAASENTTAQNGEPESSSEASAESIKVKKVVDSTLADGAGEPDVVPPVVVAATS